MDCSAVRDLLIEYREKELGGQRKEAVHSHLRVCEGCRTELREIEALIARIAHIPAVDPWPGFSRRLQSRLEQQASMGRGVRLRRLRLASSWIAGGVLLILAGATFSRLLLPSHELFTSSRKPDVIVAGRDEVSTGGPGQTDMGQAMALWGASADDWHEIPDWPDRGLGALALGDLESPSEEALILWNEDLAGVRSIEQLVEISGSSDSQVERVLEKVGR